ncbi:PAS domain S-box-containing protein/diguanylate cyclase (GGDEF)-like protein [Kineococcus xinjiangensis]|uniref:PAS domain S-box-containing protein/diguanylate cyclase (GGDEF)-like protein n=1 Tax=Kineococcus xinjiangensis TaxID=512762 RepID=A0A2S6IW76_9ACTN|nr:EAL domain-containing protein [Kineococcus xinjiangensis]PPK98612.1 PAS domain S-box-containing protein/diguanylate cyclase (GGDEF)-like protein [Kineococcus xinjiangensis]
MGSDPLGAVDAAILDAVWSDGDPWVACRAVRDGSGAVVDFEYLRANERAVQLVGLGPLAGRRMLELVPEVRDSLFVEFRQALEEGRSRDVELPGAVREGQEHWRGGWYSHGIRVSGDLLVVHWRDSTAEHEQAETTKRSEQRLTALVEHASDVVTVVGADRRISYVTPAAERVLGRDVLGEDVFAAVHPDQLDLAQTVFEQLEAEGLGETVELELQLRHAAGNWRWVHVRATNHLADPAVAGVVINWRDVTEQRELADRLRRDALHDPLTGLPNRRFLTAELERAMARTQREDSHVGVVFCDVDHFKAVNDALGHPAGDELLQAVAARLRHAVRPADVVARLGGDEFVVLAEDLAPPAAAARAELTALARRIRTALRGGYRLAGRETPVTTTMGASSGRHPLSAVELLAEADTALYEAKRFGRDRLEVFDQDLHQRNRDRLDLEVALRRALGEGELQLHYQPQIDVASGRTVGAEALLRWLHPERGVLLPAEFLPLAEESGLIVDVGAWVLTAAMTGAAGWAGVDGEDAPYVTINLSARQLAHPGLLDDIDAALAASGIAPSRVEVEVPESVTTDDLDATGEVLKAVRARGIGVALDDFGSGWTSLTSLQRLPVDTVKLDRGFVIDLTSGTGCGGTAVVEAVTTLAHALGKTVIAEGVETAAQHVALRGLGCDRAQGYLYGAPARTLAAGVAPG